MNVQLGAYREGFAAGRESVMAMLREPSEEMVDLHGAAVLRAVARSLATAIEASGK